MKQKVRCLDCATHRECKCLLTGRPVTPESFRNCKLFSSLASAIADQCTHATQQQPPTRQEQQTWDSSAN